MQTWTATLGRSAPREPVLVIGPDDALRRALTREIEALRMPVVTADDLRTAVRDDAPASARASTVLVPERAIRTDTFEQELAALRIRTGSPGLVPIAFGRSPDPARRRALRQAGVDLALFGRFGRHALRFQINRALSPWSARRPRGELRAPMEWRTRTHACGRSKAVRCYSLSSRGAYFVTPRPWVVGSQLAIELPIPRGTLLLAGHVLYTRMGDEDGGRGLPRGMAVGFDPLSEHLERVIRADVSATQRALEV